MSPVDPTQLDALHAKLDQLLERSGPPQRFMSIKTAAIYTDLSQESLRRMIERRDLTAHRPVRGKILIDRLELDRAILGSTTRPLNGRGSRSHGPVGQCTSGYPEGETPQQP